MITVDDFINAIRFFNAGVGAIVFFWCLLKTSEHWSKYDEVGRAGAACFTLTAFSISYAAIENIVLNGEVGARSVFHMLALLCLIRVLQNTKGGKSMFHGEGNRAADH